MSNNRQLQMQARTRALVKLSQAEPELFLRLHNKERKKLGLPAVGKTGPGPKPGSNKEQGK